eukprot:8227674-Pyramimonas_sp.AAC.1
MEGVDKVLARLERLRLCCVQPFVDALPRHGSPDSVPLPVIVPGRCDGNNRLGLGLSLLNRCPLCNTLWGIAATVANPITPTRLRLDRITACPWPDAGHEYC